MPQDDTLLRFFKALADGNRLRLVGLLAHRPHSVEELATVLDLRASTVSHHLSKLQDAGLVRSETQGHYHVYSLDLDSLHERARTLASDDGLKELADVEGLEDPFDRKILSAFLDDDGRITQFPMKRKKFEVLLRYALTLFEDEGPWDEAEVNRRLEELSDDTATLRRGFIDHGLMTRDKGGRAYSRA
ncbi:MAG: metalloregulator ArsR/SmtB family transcription factor [Gemmatimonadota bacterium]|jgi:biotin operon repressor